MNPNFSSLCSQIFRHFQFRHRILDLGLLRIHSARRRFHGLAMKLSSTMAVATCSSPPLPFSAQSTNDFALIDKMSERMLKVPRGFLPSHLQRSSSHTRERSLPPPQTPTERH